jgi:hypothetical protein
MSGTPSLPGGENHVSEDFKLMSWLRIKLQKWTVSRITWLQFIHYCNLIMFGSFVLIILKLWSLAKVLYEPSEISVQA